MIKRAFKFIVTLIMIAVLTMQYFLCLNVLAEYELNDDSTRIMLTRADSYDIYMYDYNDKLYPSQTVAVDISNIESSKGNVEILTDYKGKSGNSVLTDEYGFVQWEVDVPAEGLYNINIDYYNIEGKGSNIERAIWINETIPFFEARNIIFSRVWKANSNVFRTDNRGNEIKPEQKEVNMWQNTFVYDQAGYYTEPLCFFFYKGKNKFAIQSIKEPMVIGSITLTQKVSETKYSDAYKEFEKDPLFKQRSSQLSECYKLQAENDSLHSDVMLYPYNDRTSPMVEMFDYSKIKINVIGGERWKKAGQWIEWNVKVEKDGYYNIAFKYKQNFSMGSFSCRKLYIDGAVPYLENHQVKFAYNNAFENGAITDENGVPMLFKLDAGEHKIRLEVSLGPISKLLSQAEDSVYSLNIAYTKLLMMTGADPDIYRDYRIDVNAPDIIKLFNKEKTNLRKISADLRATSKMRNDKTAIFDRLAFQLDDMVKNPDTIPSKMNNFKQNIAALSTFIMTASEQPLEFDYLMVYTPNHKLPKADTNIFGKILHEIRSFIASFMSNQASIGNVYESKDAINVWMFSGRDQAQVLKSIIDKSFTPEKNIKVNLQILTGDVLLPAVVAGQGPDLTISTGVGEPVNYALRGAVQDLSQFDGFDEVAARFNESAMKPVRFNGGTYALPETETFMMLFYRNDIMNELGLPIPGTWDQVINIIPELKKNGMDFGLYPNMGTYAMFLFQNGGDFYKNSGTQSDLSSQTALAQFKKWTDFYIDYKLPISFDFNNRFRSGEIPIGVSDYSTYNYLTVFAPELNGLWEFAPVPGIADGSGKINRSVPGNSIYTMMMSTCKNKKNAWDFMKWWTSMDTQVQFGLEMESLLGPSSRYPTANKEAFARLPWSSNDYRKLSEQWEWVLGIEQVPGGYYTSRYIDNAFRNTVYAGSDYRETLLDYTDIINQEIKDKLSEYDLDKE